MELQPRESLLAAKPATATTPEVGPSQTRRQVLWGIVVLTAIALLVSGTAYTVQRWRTDPDIFLLESHDGAAWLRANHPFVRGIFKAPMGAMFSTQFTLRKPVTNARLQIRAFRRCRVQFNGVIVYDDTSEKRNWKEPLSIPLPGPLRAGLHDLRIVVLNDGSHACLWLSAPELGIATSPDWEVTLDQRDFTLAVDALAPRSPDVAVRFPTAAESLARHAVLLLSLFISVFFYVWLTPRSADAASGRWQLTPPRVRWLLLAAWTVLGANNLWRLPVGLGYDISDHYDYIRFIVDRHRLPVATDGWQMFQSPLMYLLCAPSYALLSHWFDQSTVEKLLRVFPLLCGLLQIEIVYRVARTLFRRQPDLQTIATVVGGLLPMHIYISQIMGNEPLAGCLTAIVVLLCAKLLIVPIEDRSRWYFAVLGAAWGLALLERISKPLDAS